MLISLMICMSSCKPEPIPSAYAYESNPVFTWGYAEFYGDYYNHGNYNIGNNVVALRLFTNGLFIQNDTLKGTGQMLLIEDIFSAPADTLLPQGIYRPADTGEPFTFLPGKAFPDGSQSIPSGAYIYYIEANPLKSKTAYITDGTMDIGLTNDTLYTIECRFTLDGKSALSGTFARRRLPHLDKTVTTTPAGARRLVIN